MSHKQRPLTDTEVNHLRKLLGWIDGEIGQAPEDMLATLKKIAPAIGQDLSEEGRLRMKESYNKAAAVPKYVRAAVAALRKTLVKCEGEVMDVDSVRTVRHLEK